MRVAAFADGSRLLFDGLTREQARSTMDAAMEQHGDRWKNNLRIGKKKPARSRRDGLGGLLCWWAGVLPYWRSIGFKRAAAAAAGQSLQGYILQAVEERMEREAQKGGTADE